MEEEEEEEEEKEREANAASSGRDDGVRALGGGGGASLYPDLRPLQPSAPPVYPVVSNHGPDPQTFRLTEISRIRHELNFELDKYRGLRRKYKKWDSILGWSTHISTGCSTGASAAAVACISMGLAFPISVPLGATSVALGAAAFITVKVKNNLVSRVVRNEKVIILASSKINSISKLISKILSDSDVTDEEYKLVVQEYERYLEMKKELKAKKVDNSNPDKDIFGKEFQEKFSTDLKNLLSTINGGQGYNFPTKWSSKTTAERSAHSGL